MKKKLIIVSILTTFISLVALLTISDLIIYNNQKNSYETTIRNDLSIAESFYDADKSDYGPEATLKLLTNSYSEARLTIVSSSGVVRIDTEKDVTSNHLDRPEILNPGTIVYRYSDTLSEDMMYLAGKDIGSNGTTDFVRIAIPVSTVKQTATTIANWGSLGIICLTIISAIITYFSVTSSLKPLKQEIDELSKAVNEPPSNNPDVKDLQAKVVMAKKLLDERYEALDKEKQKYESLLDEMSQGLVALNSKGIVEIINLEASSTFHLKKEDALGENYHFLSANETFLSNTKKAIEEGKESSFDYEKDGRIYLLNISPLEESFQKEQTKYGAAILSLDVTDKRKLEEAKRDFFVSASHELKTPLTAIIGYQELVEAKVLSTESEKMDATKRTLKEARRMKDILFDMLSLSKLEGALPKNIKTVNLDSIIKDSLSSHSSQIKEMKLNVEYVSSETKIKMNEEDAKNLLDNLISNAIKYNKEKGTIKIEVSPKSFEISDTGRGIPSDDQSRVFERFYQVDPSLSSKLGGTGLGLSIVKHICLDYGFSITLKSDLGIGTKIAINFKN